MPGQDSNDPESGLIMVQSEHEEEQKQKDCGLVMVQSEHEEEQKQTQTH
jgi:hypothetical protein